MKPPVSKLTTPVAPLIGVRVRAVGGHIPRWQHLPRTGYVATCGYVKITAGMALRSRLASPPVILMAARLPPGGGHVANWGWSVQSPAANNARREWFGCLSIWIAPALGGNADGLQVEVFVWVWRPLATKQLLLPYRAVRWFCIGKQLTVRGSLRWLGLLETSMPCTTEAASTAFHPPPASSFDSTRLRAQNRTWLPRRAKGAAASSMAHHRGTDYDEKGARGM